MKYLPMLSLLAMPALSQAATVQTYPIEEAISRNIDGCGYEYSKSEDFPIRPKVMTTFVFVNDGEKGLVKIDNQFVVVQSADKQGRGTYESVDHRVLVEPQTQLGQQIGGEIWLVEGNLKFTIGNVSKIVPVKGYMGC